MTPSFSSRLRSIILWCDRTTCEETSFPDSLYDEVISLRCAAVRLLAKLDPPTRRGARNLVPPQEEAVTSLRLDLEKIETLISSLVEFGD